MVELIILRIGRSTSLIQSNYLDPCELFQELDSKDGYGKLRQCT